jgi:hypothetical protein
MLYSPKSLKEGDVDRPDKEIPGFRKTAEQLVEDRYRSRTTSGPDTASELSLESDSADKTVQTETDGHSEIIIRSTAEKQALFYGLFTYLYNHSKIEVEKDASPTLMADIDILRHLYRQLTIDLGKENDCPPVLWLQLGIIDFIPEALLKEWIENQDGDGVEKLIHEYALYFVGKRDKSQNPDKLN